MNTGVRVAVTLCPRLGASVLVACGLRMSGDWFVATVCSGTGNVSGSCDGTYSCSGTTGRASPVGFAIEVALAFGPGTTVGTAGVASAGSVIPGKFGSSTCCDVRVWAIHTMSVITTSNIIGTDILSRGNRNGTGPANCSSNRARIAAISLPATALSPNASFTARPIPPLTLRASDTRRVQISHPEMCISIAVRMFGLSRSSI